MTYFDSIPPNRFALLAAVIGILLNLGLDANEQNSLGNFLVTVGQTMLTVAAQSQNLEAHPTQSNLCQHIDRMSAELEKMKKQLQS